MTTIDMSTRKGLDPEVIASIENMKMLLAKDPRRQAAMEKELIKEKRGIQKGIREIKKEIADLTPLEQLTFSFLPNEMTRISPFSPMSKSEMGNRSVVKQIFNNPWGTMELQGERLSVFDESVLLAVLKLATLNKSFMFSTTFHEILGIMGTTSGINTYKAVRSSLDRLTGTFVKITIKSKDTIKSGLSNHILSHVKYSKYNFDVKIDEYFGGIYLEGLITSIDLDFRAKLKGDITKAMYRFYEGQPVNFEIHIDKFCDAINLNKAQQKFELRKKINKSLKELISHGYFEYGKINKKDHIVTKKIMTAMKKV
jgi:hypothetical protein